VAFAALAAVGHPRSDGALLGAAAVLPRELEDGGGSAERRAVLGALAAIDRLTMGAAGAWAVERVSAGATQRNLLPDTWSRPSRTWATVTPVVLDRFPDDPYSGEAIDIVARGCTHVGLPRPAAIALGPSSIVPGAPAWHEFLPSRKPGKPRRPRVHAVLEFRSPVRGPLLLGAERYRGLGLCRPVGSGVELI
jgi:CRISPR-associated protein Csb2